MPLSKSMMAKSTCATPALFSAAAMYRVLFAAPAIPCCHHRLRHLCSGVLLRKGSFERGPVGTYEKQGHETVSPLYACDDSEEEGPRTCAKERCSLALE